MNCKKFLHYSGLLQRSPHSGARPIKGLPRGMIIALKREMESCRLMSTMSRFWLMLAAICGVLLFAVPASADVVLTLDSAGGLAGSVPAGTTFGTVTLHQCTGTAGCPVGSVQVTVALSVNPPAGTTYFANANAAFSVQWSLVNNPAITISNVSPVAFDTMNTASGNYLDASPYTAGEHCGHSGEVRSGCFEYGIGLDSGGTSEMVAGPLVFDVTKSGGLLLSDFAVLTGSQSAGLVYFAVDMGINCNSSGCTTGTVGASNSPPNTESFPEPASLAIFGAGAAGLLGYRRRRKSL
jgi:hypothetical protein